MITIPMANLEKFADEDNGQPLVMLNLARFKVDGGRERYFEYLGIAGPIAARFGAEIVFAGETLPALAAEQGQAWDVVALVRYPNRHAFLQMLTDPDYASADQLRMSALQDAVLQPVPVR